MEAIDLAHNVVVVTEASLNSVASLLNLYILGNSSVAIPLWLYLALLIRKLCSVYRKTTKQSECYTFMKVEFNDSAIQYS